MGDCFRRSGSSRKIYVVEKVIDRAGYPRHVRLVANENREIITVALSALLDARLFERAGS